MYYSTDAITGFRATATDGELGKVLGFGFDDQTHANKELDAIDRVLENGRAELRAGLEVAGEYVDAKSSLRRRDRDDHERRRSWSSVKPLERSA